MIASATGAAPAHRGVAYAVFEQLQLADFGNRIPSLTVEVIADPDEVTIGGIAQAIGAGGAAGDGPADTLTGFAASGGSIAGAVAVLADAAGGWFVPRGGGVVLANRLGAARAIEPVALTRMRAAADQVPVAISVAHHDPARDYQIGLQRADRSGAGWQEGSLELPAACSAGRARAIATAALLRAEAGRETIRATIDDSVDLRPGDAVTLPGDARAWRIARAAIEASGTTLDLVTTTYAPATQVADPGGVVGAPDERIGRTVAAVIELPPLDEVLAATPRLFVAAAGSGAGWRRAALDVSMDDGASWRGAGSTAPAADMGALAMPLATGSAAIEDRVNAIEVLLANDGMALASADAMALDRGANLALVGDELIQFARAVQIAPRRWRLTGLWRGRGGTGVVTHPAGERFVAIEEVTLAPLAGSARIGERVAIAATGPGDEGVPTMTSLLVTGRSVAPPSPVHLASARIPGGGARVTWIRRSRLGWRWNDGGDVPLAEETERYRVTVRAAGSTRTVIVESGRADVTAGELAAGNVTVSVCQLGSAASSAETEITIEE